MKTQRPSRRRALLNTINALCATLGRPVWWHEVLTAARQQEVRGSRRLILASLRSLVATKHVVLQALPWGDERGRNRYWPAEQGEMPDWKGDPSAETWLGAVAAACQRLWEERREALGAGTPVPPITVADVRQRMEREGRWAQLRDTQLLINALRRLSRAPGPVLRRVAKAGVSGNLYVPLNVGEEDIDAAAAFSSDADRAIEAVRRALGRAEAPMVSAKQCAAEVASDPTLALRSRRRFALFLSEISKTHRKWAGRRRGMMSGRLVNLGAPRGNALYALVAGDVTEAEMMAYRASLLAIRLRHEWAELESWEHDRQLRREEWLVLATSRAGVLLRRTADMLVDIDAAGGENGELLVLRDEIESKRKRWLEAVHERGMALNGVGVDDGCWIDAETAYHLLSEVPLVERRGDPMGMVMALGASVRRRVDRQRYADLRNGPGKIAHDYDWADVSLFRAERSDDPFLRAYASWIRQRLGPVRDPQVLATLLQAAERKTRIWAIIALGFLADPRGAPLVRELEIPEDDDQLLEASRWALEMIAERRKVLGR